MNYTVETRKYLADTITPVGLFMALRSRSGAKLLLESADYHGTENSFSYLCFDPLAELIFTEAGFEQRDFVTGTITTKKRGKIAEELRAFLKLYAPKSDLKLPPGVVYGAFGYMGYDTIEQIEDNLKLQERRGTLATLPNIRYTVFRSIVAINHFRNEMYLIHTAPPEDKTTIAEIENLLNSHVPSKVVAKFKRRGPERSSLSDEAHAAIIERCKSHIVRGDVFQIVPSRRFEQDFEGDEFTVYRALRSLNPSPYLFFFDYGEYKIFGSSPEAQIVIGNGKASIFPIAGTYPRSGDDEKDTEAARKLLDDPKENAEHVMLVDLARNDLSIHCHPVQVDRYREVQLYSHVIHLVSKVSGKLNSSDDASAILTATFPAGTLTGAPKYKAMQLINSFEPERRYMYGGALGFIGFDGGVNHAIIIRSFVSTKGTLYSQAGSGVVYDSKPEYEVAEVKHKLGALRAAILRAEEA